MQSCLVGFACAQPGYLREDEVLAMRRQARMAYDSFADTATVAPPLSKARLNECVPLHYQNPPKHCALSNTAIS
jgi:hypothetical protein